MRLPSTIRFSDDSLRELFYRLEKGNASEVDLFNSINKAMDEIERDAFCGIQIPKRLIPKEYREKYYIANLWKYDLPKGWRLVYSIFNDEIVIISLVIEWFDHKDYERRFKY